MSAIVQASLCAAIFILVGFIYRPKPDGNYRLTISLLAFAICAITGMQFMSLVGRIALHHTYADASWFNNAFYAVFVILFLRTRGNIAKVWDTIDERLRWDGRERRNARQ